MPSIVVLGPSLPDYPRTKNILTALRSVGQVTTRTTFAVNKPYRLSFLITLAQVVWSALTLRLPTQIDYLVVLFPDNENVLVARLHRWLYRRSYTIIFDAFISIYDTYLYNKPLPLIKQPRPLLTPMLKWWLRWYERHLFALPDILLTDTPRHGRYLKELLGLNRNFQTILLAADENCFKPTKLHDDSFWQQSKLRVLWYGHLSDMHGMDYILNALDALSGDAIECTIVGDLRSYSPTLRERLQRNGRLHYHEILHPNYLPVSHIADLVAAHHVCLGIFGTTAKAQNVIANKEVEALASARCLITRQGDRDYLISLKNCVMTNPNNPIELAQWLAKLAADRILLRRIAQQGRKDYELFASLSSLTQSLQRLLATAK